MFKFKKLSSTLLAGLIGVSAGKFLTPPEVKIKEVEKIVYRERSTSKTDTNHRIDKKETIKPDGTRIVETISTTQRTSDKKVDTSLNSETERTSLTKQHKDWHVTLAYMPVLPGYQEQSYALNVQRRFLSELYLGVMVSDQKQIGISIGIGF